MLNERRRQALEADLGVLVTHVVDPRTAHLLPEAQSKVTALHAAELYLKDYRALGFPSGGGEGGRSTDVADPTFNAATSREHRYENDAVDLDHALKMMELHASKAAAIVGRMRVVPPLADAPTSTCGNPACDHVCKGEGNDRIRTPKGTLVGLCWKCFKHWEKNKRHWPIKADGRDVRTTAA